MDANEILANATPEQAKWVIERLVSKTDREAAIAIGIHPTTVSRWENKADLDRAVIALLGDKAEGARTILVDAVIDAAKEKVSGLSNKGIVTRQAAASEILDRVLGKSLQTQEVILKEPVQFVIMGANPEKL